MLGILRKDYETFTNSSFFTLLARKTHFYAIQMLKEGYQPLSHESPLDDVLRAVDLVYRGKEPDICRRIDECRIELVERLLKLGFDPNEVREGKTTWGRYLEACNEYSHLMTLGTVAPIMSLLIKVGAARTVRTGFATFVRTPDPHRIIDRMELPADVAASLYEDLRKSEQVENIKRTSITKRLKKILSR